MFIGNDEDGINWVDFRFENFPMFCFGCGLIGHNMESCRNPPIPIIGGTNPRGAWLRSRNYGHRIYERKEKTFSINFLKSISGGQFSPLPKGLLDKMAAINLTRTSPQSTGQYPSQHTTQFGNIKFSDPRNFNKQMAMEVQHIHTATSNTQGKANSNDKKIAKRKLGYNGKSEVSQEKEMLPNNDMAGLAEKANQLQ